MHYKKYVVRTRLFSLRHARPIVRVPALDQSSTKADSSRPAPMQERRREEGCG